MLQRHGGAHEDTGRQMENRENGGSKFAAVMEAAPSDGRAYSTDSLESLPPSLVRSLQTKIWLGWGSGVVVVVVAVVVGGVESGVGGGVGLLERVIFFFQRGERRTVMCAELMTKGPFMCSVCR